MGSENIVFSHLINEKNDLDYFDMIENFNWGMEFFISYLILLVILFFVCLGLSRLTIKPTREYYERSRISKSIFLFQNLLDNDEHLALKLFFLFLNLFIWFTLLFLTNNIKVFEFLKFFFSNFYFISKTNKVVVNTGELVKDKDDILKTKKSNFYIFNLFQFF